MRRNQSELEVYCSAVYLLIYFFYSLGSFSHDFITSLPPLSFHLPRPPFQLSSFPPGVTQRGRRSRLHMAPGACGSRLANQCESTSGTSLGQTISLSIHSGCCRTLSHSVQFPSRQAPPGRQCALTHRRDISQSLLSPPGISAGRHLLTLLHVPQTCQEAREHQGPALPFADMLDWGSLTCSGRDTDADHHFCATCSDYLTAFHISF